MRDEGRHRGGARKEDGFRGLRPRTPIETKIGNGGDDMAEKRRNKRYGKRIDLELTHKLYAELKLRAQAEGVGMRTIIRRGLMRELGYPLPKYRIPPEVRRGYRELAGQLAKIGNNLNQVARHLNRGGEFRPQVIEALQNIEKAMAVLAVRCSPSFLLKELQSGVRDE